ncbi:MAG: hypothetical protein JO261_14725, partial [Alphaproteobacteria bacterium]|nr:hypothetical protein [Alphaproteobacteria bacterium]MBV9694949.1 hypothetical protein [Alphaproteobacteria bacterium]
MTAVPPAVADRHGVHIMDDDDNLQSRSAVARPRPHNWNSAGRKIAARPESLDHAIMIAWCDWIAGMIIGLMPLLCHLLLHFAARSAPDWDDNWAPDLLFITISNSGLVAVTVFTRMLGAHLTISSLTPWMRIVWGITIVCFALASMLYGAAATGMSNRLTGWASLIFVIFSGYCSLSFELAVAREHFAPKRPRKLPDELGAA